MSEDLNPVAEIYPQLTAEQVLIRQHQIEAFASQADVHALSGNKLPEADLFAGGLFLHDADTAEDLQTVDYPQLQSQIMNGIRQLPKAATVTDKQGSAIVTQYSTTFGQVYITSQGTLSEDGKQVGLHKVTLSTEMPKNFIDLSLKNHNLFVDEPVPGEVDPQYLRPPQTFAEQYPLPDDQLVYQIRLHDSYAQRFPASQSVMNLALIDIQRAAGINLPKYKIADIQAEQASADGLANELGFLDTPMTEHGYDTLQLRKGVDRSDSEYAKLSENEQRIANKSDDGMMVIGLVPEETTVMLDGVYGLIGANVIRDERKEGVRQGTVLRQGEYMGEPIWLAEDFYDNCPYYNGQNLLKVRILGKKNAELALNDLNENQKQEFIKSSGLATGTYISTLLNHSITKENYREIGDVLGQTKAILDGENSMPAVDVPRVTDPEAEKQAGQRRAKFWVV